MPRARLDLPVAQTVPGRLLSWLTAGLIYAAVVALAVVMMADRALLSLAERAQLATVTLPMADDADLATALEILYRDRAVLDAAPLGNEELAALMTPWLGETGAAALPWPAMIDLRLDPRAEPDLTALQDALRATVAGATLTVEPGPDDRAVPVAALVRAWSGVLLALALPAGLLAIAALTRLSLRLCRDAVELLRLMGASPAYQAAQLERHATACGLRGAAGGFALALLTVATLLYGLRASGVADAIEVRLRPLDWVLLTGMAATTLLLAVAVVRATVYWQLQRLA